MTLSEFQTGQQESNDESYRSDHDKNYFTFFYTFGGDSIMEGSLSQNAQSYNSINTTPDDTKKTYYKEALPLFQEMMSSCPNNESFNECLTLMRTQIAKHVALNPLNTKDYDSSSVYVYGENNTNKKKVKRHKSTGEMIMG